PPPPPPPPPPLPATPALESPGSPPTPTGAGRASPGRRLAAAVSLISSLASELPPDEAAVLDSPLRPPSPPASEASFASVRSPSRQTAASLAAEPPASAPEPGRPRPVHPAYLRLVRGGGGQPQPSQQQPASPASERPMAGRGSRRSSGSLGASIRAGLGRGANHLLLSGVEFVAERAFGRPRPATAPGNVGAAPTQPPAVAQGGPFGLRRAGRRSLSNIPPPLAIAGLRGAPPVPPLPPYRFLSPRQSLDHHHHHHRRRASAGSPLASSSSPSSSPRGSRDRLDQLIGGGGSRPGSLYSDAASFRTAQSSMSHPALAAAAAAAAAEDLSRHDDFAACESPVVPPTVADRQPRSMMQMVRGRPEAPAPPEPEPDSAVISPGSAVISPRSAVISPLSQKSVPVVVQARRARHPVYRFGALANETFEDGRHQDAYDMYSLGLQLLDPPPGTTAAELLARADVQQQLARLGWAEPPSAGAAATGGPGGSGSGGGRRKARSLFSPRQWHRSRPATASGSPGAAAEGAPAAAAATTGGGERRGWRPFSSSRPATVIGGKVIGGSGIGGSGIGGSGIGGSGIAAGEPAARGSVVVIDEPLPAGVAQTDSGKFEFSAEMMSQLRRQTSPPDMDGEGEAEDSEASWEMAAGDERADVSALLFSNRSAAAYALGKFAAADSDAGRAIALRPAWAKGYFRRGEALLALGRVREAYTFYRRAVALEPHDMHARVSCERARILAQNQAMGLGVVQLLAGRDFAVRPRGLHPIRTRIFEFAAEMQNYVYLVADAETRKCVVVDACWDVDGILAAAAREGLLLAAAAVTHAHFDHVGGTPPPPFASLRIRVAGLAELKRRMPHLPLLVHPLDIPDVMAANPHLKLHHFTPTPNGFAFTLGARTRIHFLHTPGHTPGSQCLLVNDCRLFSGDTLFPGSCGRVDLPGGSLPDMVHSLQARLRAVPDATIVYPGHEYAGEWTSIAREKKRGFLRPAGDGPAHSQWARLDAAARRPSQYQYHHHHHHHHH
ncbi:hypothetical protein H4R18_005961, partial [Coemansia javaensis]